MTTHSLTFRLGLNLIFDTSVGRCKSVSDSDGDTFESLGSLSPIIAESSPFVSWCVDGPESGLKEDGALLSERRD